jgi:hypothetical protein
MIAALAFYDAGEDFRRLERVMREHLDEGFIPFFEFFGGEDGGFHMGYEYSRYYIFTLLQWFWVLNSATGVDRHERHPWVMKTGHFLGAGVRDDGTYWAIGDNHSRFVKWVDRVAMNRLAALSEDPVLVGLAHDFEGFRHRPPDVDELFYRLMWGSTDALRFDPQPAPEWQAFQAAGVFALKSEHDGDQLAMIFKNTPTYLFNHAHRDAGSFVVRLNGELAIDSGHYDRYKSDHWLQYYIRTVAHNTLLLHHPDERFPFLFDRQMVNDGGQLFSQTRYAQPHTREHLDSGMFKVGENEIVRDDDEAIVLRMDVTRNYWDQKCERFARTIVILRRVTGWPWPVVVVLDDVRVTDPRVQARWLLHTTREPELMADHIRIEHGEGVMRVHVMDPDPAVVNWIGGPGREFWVADQHVESRYPDHYNRVVWAGAGRVEVRHPDPQMNAPFAVVLVPARSGEAFPGLIQREPQGIRVGNWMIRWNFENDTQQVQIEEWQDDSNG